MVSEVVRGRAAVSLAVGLLAMMAAFLALFFVGVGPAQAATTFTVNSTGDENDLDFLGTADGKCDVDSGTTGDQCTLKAAIQEANGTTDADTINFNIPGTGVHTIATTGLPPISEPVSINGYTQRPCSSKPAPCSKPNTLAKGTNAKLMIDLDGGGTSNDSGFFINAPNVVVKGLAIHSFDTSGFFVTSTGDNLRIEGNFIGTDPGGIQNKGNSGDAVFIESASNVSVGGETPAARNLISGNDGAGVHANTTNNTEVEGNLIGTQKDGTSPLPNAGPGVNFETDGENNSVGGLTVGSANTIAFNGQAGVDLCGGLDAYVQASVLRNSIFSNGGEGISLCLIDNDDPLDTDEGANGGQNFPVINTATGTRRATIIVGTLHSKASQTYTLMFFSNPPPPESSDEGKTFKVQKSITTDSSGDGTFSFKLRRGQRIPVGQFVTATATSSNGDSSEFSAAQEVVRP
jgi:hypothetical protein